MELEDKWVKRYKILMEGLIKMEIDKNTLWDLSGLCSKKSFDGLCKKFNARWNRDENIFFENESMIPFFIIYVEKVLMSKQDGGEVFERRLV